MPAITFDRSDGGLDVRQLASSKEIKMKVKFISFATQKGLE